MALRIKNWHEFQHYKDRCPPWIKLHRKLLDDKEFNDLEGDVVKTLVFLWMLAAEDKAKGGNLPSLDEIAWRLRIDSTVLAGHISKLKHWIAYDDSSLLAKVEQCADPETETETEIERETEYIYKKNKTSKDQVEETSKVDLHPIDEALEFLPVEQDRQLAKFILTAWPDCTAKDAIAWVEQAKNYLLQLEEEPLEWIQEVATSRSPNDPVYVQGRNKLHQWLMNCLKNTIRKQAEQSKPKLAPVKYGMDT
jgi:hypothetical protein